MLNRRILRIKAFKAVYTYTENRSLSLKEAEVMLDRSCESTRDLYLFLLSVIAPLTDVARNRLEAARSKFNPTEEELNPNFKFADNRIAAILSVDPDFCKLLSRKHLSWEQYDAFLWNLYDRIRSRDYFKEYLASDASSVEEDAALWSRIFEEEFPDNGELESILEDISIWWNDDLEYALGWCCISFKSLAKGMRWDLPPLYLSEMSAEYLAEVSPADYREVSPRHIAELSAKGHGCTYKAFVTMILRKAYARYEEFCAAVAELTPKWDRERICATDLALIVTAMAEADAFPDMPSKVIINEYVELSKFYSTPESRSFVNGLLDRLLKQPKQ